MLDAFSNRVAAGRCAVACVRGHGCRACPHRRPSGAGAARGVRWAGTPAAVLVGPDRRVLGKQIGSARDVEDRWQRLIEEHLKARKRPR